MFELRLAAVIAMLALAGWCSWHLFAASLSPQKTIRSRIEDCFAIFLTGIGTISVILFVLVLIGKFHRVWILSAIALLLLVYAVQFVKGRIVRRASVVFYVLFTFSFFVCSLTMTRLAPPFESIIHGQDASVFLGAAIQLAKNGTLSYQDPVVMEMSSEERAVIFHNRFADDTTGNPLRFPGGVRLMDSSRGTVSFSFYHLYPAWLGFGILFLGLQEFLSLQSIFFLCALSALFFLGLEFSGIVVGAIAPLMISFFYPQMFFAFMPTSELFSQALFLGGMWTFVSAFRNEGRLNAANQNLTGLLWGNLFLTKMEAIFLMWICWILAFTFFPWFAQKLRDWRRMLLILILFTGMALSYQITRGEYLYVLTSNTLLSNQPIVLIGIEAYGILSGVASTNPAVFYSVIVLLSVLLVALSQRWWFPNIMPSWRSRLLGTVLMALLLWPILSKFSTLRFLKHIQWISIYLSPVLLISFIAGAAWFLLQTFRHEPAKRFLFAVILLFIPLIIYLVRPQVLIEQPWGIRRFVPFIFPLLFLLGLSGWRLLLARIPSFGTVCFVSASICLILFFYSKSSYLFTDRLYADLFHQTNIWKQNIPHSALTILPDEMAYFHPEAPLQFLGGLDTVLLPFEERKDRRRVVFDYLMRQIGSRPVVVVLPDSNNVPAILRTSFMLDPIIDGVLSYRIVEATEELIFPDRSSKISLKYKIYRLLDAGKRPEKSFVAYNDPDIVFTGFHEIEQGYRWTQGSSTIENFQFHTSGKQTTLILSIPAHSVLADKANPSLWINDTVEATLWKKEGMDHYFRLENSALPAITKITIRSANFIPSELGMNHDSRRLGVRFYSVRFVREESIGTES